MPRKFFDHEQFNFEFQCALGGVHYGAGDVGEMLSTADRVVDRDADSWCQEWIATAQLRSMCTPLPANTTSPTLWIRSRLRC